MRFLNGLSWLCEYLLTNMDGFLNRPSLIHLPFSSNVFMHLIILAEFVSHHSQPRLAWSFLVCARTVSNRLNDDGYSMLEKLSRDDGDGSKEWLERRCDFCRDHADTNWETQLQAAGDFHFFTYYPPSLKRRHAVKSAPRTIMSAAERKKAAFQKPRRHVFKKKEYKMVQKAKVFGLTTSTGKVLNCITKQHPESKDFCKLVDNRIGPFMKAEFPNRRWNTLLLDGEPLMHTDEAKAMLRKWNLKVLPNWPAHSPDLNPEDSLSFVWKSPTVGARCLSPSISSFSGLLYLDVRAPLRNRSARPLDKYSRLSFGAFRNIGCK